jgi:hypothetical protein
MELQPTATEGALRVGFGWPAAIVADSEAAYLDLAAPLARQGVRSIRLAPDAPLAGLRLLLIDAESAGGPEAALALAARSRAMSRCAVALVSRHCREQVFPHDLRQAPIELRAPLSRLAVRVLLEFLATKEEGRPE